MLCFVNLIAEHNSKKSPLKCFVLWEYKHRMVCSTFSITEVTERGHKSPYLINK